MNLSKKATPIKLELQKSEQLNPGTIYVLEDADSSTAGVTGGRRTVLKTADGSSLELLTVDTIHGNPTVAGAYLAPDDLRLLNSRADPTLRLYLARDTWRKLFSSTGAGAVVPLLLALTSALVAVIFVLSVAGAPSSESQAQALLDWVRQPAVGAADPTGVAKRADEAQRCLATIVGSSDSQAPSVPGISCKPPDTHWWQDATVGSIITGAIGVLAAVLAFTPLRKQFGFQGSAK
ncbi:hypothetical protein [Kribbella sp. NPDC003557]|uniref:hypothetical protein n=1 Tax=Kribbella sp. NPDC003557 TaxID=3154449 RepID=UPI0033ADB845